MAIDMSFVSEHGKRIKDPVRFCKKYKVTKQDL